MKKYFITGLIILLPVLLTLMVAVFLFNLFTTPFVHIVTNLLHRASFALPEGAIQVVSRIIALLLLFVSIIVLGMVARHFLFRHCAQLVKRILYKIPVVGTVYQISRDLFSAIFSPDGKQAFKGTVSIPFPYGPHKCLGLSTGEAPKECEEKVGEPLTPVFAPTAPHPISGFLFLVPTREVDSVDMTKEEMIKFLVSCGIVHPGSERDS